MTKIHRSMEMHSQIDFFSEFNLLVLQHQDSIHKPFSPREETKRAWRTDWAIWIEFCDTNCVALEQYQATGKSDASRCPMPAEPRLVHDFIVFYRHDAGQKNGAGSSVGRKYKLATLQRIVSTIAKAHELAGYASNPARDPLVLEVLRNTARFSEPQVQALPIRWADIEQFLHLHIAPDSHSPRFKRTKPNAEAIFERPIQRVRAAAMLATAYDAVMRREELVATRVEHLHSSDSGLSLQVPSRETNAGQRNLSPETSRHIYAWIDATGITCGPLFCQLQRNGGVRLRSKTRGPFLDYGKALGPSEVNKIFKRCMTSIGWPPEKVALVSGQSPRVGAVVDLENRRTSIGSIMRKGGWKGPHMPVRYANRSNKTRDA